MGLSKFSLALQASNEAIDVLLGWIIIDEQMHQVVGHECLLHRQVSKRIFLEWMIAGDAVLKVETKIESKPNWARAGPMAYEPTPSLVKIWLTAFKSDKFGCT